LRVLEKFSSVHCLQSTYVKFWKHTYNFDCQPVDYSDSEFGNFEVIFTYGYLTLKLLDWFDTLFIILKKKESQLSFLHTYHHSIVFAATYFACKWKSRVMSSALRRFNKV
jgi:GNS1/SUR4 family